MSFIVTDNGGREFERPETGLCRAVCSHIYDLGVQPSQMYEPSHKVAVIFELSQLMSKGECAGKPFMLSKIYTASVHKKANLRRDLDSWRGKAMTDEEAKGFDMEKLVGANCQLNLVEETKDGKTRVNISSILPPEKESPKLIPSGTEVPKWLKEKRLQAIQEDVAPENTNVTVEDDGLPF